MELQQERIGKTLEHIDIDSDFLNRTPIAQQLRDSSDKWDCLKLQSYEEAAYRMGENLCQQYIWQRIMQGTQKTKLTKNQQPSEEMDK
jgi:hypothetical protein